jgi:hypothetical protein
MLKRTSLVIALALLVSLPGCGGTTPCTPFPLQETTPAWLLLAGKPEELIVGPRLDYAGVCRGIEGTSITFAHIEIFDPDLQPVVFESSLLSTDKSGVSIRFTPTKLGSYHFFIGFEPIGGIQQFDLLAVSDRSSEAPLQSMPHRCNELERTRSGTWICSMNVFRGGTFQQQLPFGRTAVVGDVLWVVSASHVQRYVDTGTKLELTATLSQPWGLPEAISATENDVVMLHKSTLQLFTFDGRELSYTEPMRWLLSEAAGPLGHEGPLGVLFRAGERLAVVQNLFQGRYQSCTFQLSGGHFTRTPEACQMLEGFVVGFESQALWSAERTSPTGTPRALHRLEWGGTEFVLRASLSVPETLTIDYPLRLFRSSALPVLRPNFPLERLLGRSAVPVYEPGQTLLRLEHMDAELSSTQASASFFWGNVLDRSFAVTSARIRAVAPAP